MSDPLRSDEPSGADTGIGARALLELLRAGVDPSSLLTLLAQAPLSAEQRAVVDLFQAFHQDHAADDAADDADDAFDEALDTQRDAPARDTAEQRRRDQELADLREVNDTVAAALGACRACWGGDPRCPLCGGRGRAGAAPPDPRLFAALVVPAVRRMYAQARPPRSPTTEASP